MFVIECILQQFDCVVIKIYNIDACGHDYRQYQSFFVIMDLFIVFINCNTGIRLSYCYLVKISSFNCDVVTTV